MEYQGKSVFGGIAIGRLFVYRKRFHVAKRVVVDDPEAEIGRFFDARETAKKQLRQLYDKALKEVGEANAAVFEVHRMMLDDPDLVEPVEELIRTEQVNAAYAVTTVGKDLSARFEAMEDKYMRGRALDIRDVSNRVVEVLLSASVGNLSLDEPVILLAEDLTPSETVLFDRSKILSFVTRYGSVNSHTAVMARTMNIPTLIGTDYPGDAEGKIGIVDGHEGKLIVDPDENTLQKYRKKKEADEEKTRLLLDLKGKENVTADGTKIELYANIGSVKDLADVLANDAGGIGLFRSEFLYLESADYPTEEEQLEAYRTVAETMAPKKVIIRTFDIGTDKQADYFDLKKEVNPAMGFRAIRICLRRPEIFKTQLRAIYRAACYGNIAIMFPMIISVDEIRQIKTVIKEVKKELRDKGVDFGDVQLGVMIETPAAVMMAEELAKEVDFLSVGTNDLTQYTLAIDRTIAELEDLYDPHHPAILRMIRIAVENGHKGGARVGICGELGADTSLTETFLRMGVDELSVAPSRVLSVRDAIRRVDLRNCR